MLKEQWFQLRSSLSVAACLLFILSSTAQDSHYWTQQYGNKSLLLSGAVVGSVQDLGSVYYNPGRLALQENAAFVISAKVMQFSTVKIESGLGDGVDLSRSQFVEAPSLIAGTFKIKKIPKHKFAYSILTRRSSEIDFLFRTQETIDVLANFEGDEDFTGEVNWFGKSTERWLGLTWAYAPHPKVSVGVTNFISASNSKALLDVDLNALASDGHVVTLSRKRQYEFKQYGLLWKVGLAADFSPITAGITVTTPKLDLAGNGFFLSQRVLSGADTNYTIASEDIFEANYQEDLDAGRRSSWAVALGAGIQFERVIIHLSGEWFDKVDKYTIIEPEPFIGQSTGDTISNSLVEQLDAVVNFGIGVEISLKKELSLYASFATDYSAANAEAARFTELRPETDNAAFRADLFHLAVGAGFTVKRIEFSLGTSFNYAKDIIARPVNLPDGGDETIFDPDKTATIKIQNWKILFGLSLPISSKENKK